MPRMNTRADVLMGGGGMPGSINQRPYPFASYGRGAFRDDSTILVALVAAGGAVHAWRPLEDPNGERLELVDARGFNWIAGGGGRFAALLVPPPPGDPVLFGSLGDKPKAGAGDIAPDGTIVYKTLYHAERGITIVDPAGVVVELPDALPVDVQALAGGRAVWRGGAHGRAPLRPTLADAMNLRVAEGVTPGVDMIAYWSNEAGALVVESDGTGLGYMFRTENGFDHDLIALEGEAILVASRTAGEGPGDLVKIAISSAGLRYLVPVDGQAPPWFAAPAFGPIEITPPALVFPTFRFSHPISIYPFKAQGSGRPDVFTLGTYSENPTPPAPLPAGRLLLAHDSPADWTIPAGALRSYDAVGWELYRVTGETLEQSAARWDRQARSNLAQWPRDCFLIPMFYNQFNPATGAWLWTDREVLEGLEYLDVIANLSPRIKVIAPFSYDRANGIKPNPNLARAFNDLVDAAARAGAATLTPIPPDPPVDPPIDPPTPTKYPTAKHYRGAAVNGVIFFEHVNYAGRSWTYEGDVAFVEGANDQFSSVKVPAGVVVTLYQHRDFGGAQVALSSDAPDLRAFKGPGADGTWNDAASSVKFAGDISGSSSTRLKKGDRYVECTAAGTVTLTSTKGDASKVAITKRGERFDARFTSANRQLSIQGDGSLESRPAGEVGAFETFAAITAPAPDVVSELYRVDAGEILGGTVLQIVEE